MVKFIPIENSMFQFCPLLFSVSTRVPFHLAGLFGSGGSQFKEND